MATITDFTFPSASGKHSIHCRQWSPEGDPVGVVQLVHGVAEHIGRYHDFAEFLTRHGFAAVGDDHLGHGLSVNDPSELAWFDETDGWDKVVRDEKALHDRMKAEYPAVPHILLGHSMGSFIARTYIGYYPDDFDLCILSGTGQQSLIICRAGRFMAARDIRKNGSKNRSRQLNNMAFGPYLKGIENPIGPNDWICRDEAVIRAYGDDPLSGIPGTSGLMYDMMGGLIIIGQKDHMAKMRKDMPVLFIAGDADPVGSWGKDVPKLAGMFTAVGMKDVSYKLYPGARHEVLNELNKQEVWNDVLDWITKRI